MEAQSTVLIPRIAIKFCTQCKWNLRAAYYAQELLQTFSTSLGEVSLLPSTNGVFTITLYHHPTPPQAQSDPPAQPAEHTSKPASTPESRPSEQEEEDQTRLWIQETLIWDRTRDGGFPETKELKNRVRNVIDPKRDMGHIDRSLKKGRAQSRDKGERQDGGGNGVTEAKGRGEEGGPHAARGEGLGLGDAVQGGIEKTKEREGGAIDPESGKPRVECEDCK